MTTVGKTLLGAIAATTLIWACSQDDNLDNDTDSFTGKRDAGAEKKDSGSSKPDDKAPSTDDDDTGDDDTSTGDDDTGDDDTSTGDDDTGDDDTTEPTKDAGGSSNGDGGSKSDAGTTKPDTGGASKIAGTAAKAKCASNQKASGNMCAGFFCGVTEADIAKELNSSVCPAATPESLCSGDLSFEVAACARSTKTSNPLLSDDQLRPKVAECVYGKKAEYKDELPMKCLDCFLDAAVCASKNCLFDCLGGDSPTCDRCREKNNCNAPVMKCAELPSPF